MSTWKYKIHIALRTDWRINVVGYVFPLKNRSGQRLHLFELNIRFYVDVYLFLHFLRSGMGHELPVVACRNGGLYCMCTKPTYMMGGLGHQLAVAAYRAGQRPAAAYRDKTGGLQDISWPSSEIGTVSYPASAIVAYQFKTLWQSCPGHQAAMTKTSKSQQNVTKM